MAPPPPQPGISFRLQLSIVLLLSSIFVVFNWEELAPRLVYPVEYLRVGNISLYLATAAGGLVGCFTFCGIKNPDRFLRFATTFTGLTAAVALSHHTGAAWELQLDGSPLAYLRPLSEHESNVSNCVFLVTAGDTACTHLR